MYYAYQDDDGTLYTEGELSDQYEDLLDQSYDIVAIGDLTYAPSRVLQAVDPIAYRCGFADYTSEYEEVTFEDEDAFLATREPEFVSVGEVYYEDLGL